MPSPKTIARLEGKIQRRAAHCLQFEVADPRAGFLTITRVELSKDIATARIYYSVLGSEADRNKAEHMLKGAAGFIQRQVAGVLRTRTVPHMRWIYDESIAEAARLDKLIRKARDQDRQLRREVPGSAESELEDSESMAREPGASDDVSEEAEPGGA